MKLTQLAIVYVYFVIYFMLNFAVPCLKLLISKGLGYGVVVGSAMGMFSGRDHNADVIKVTEATTI